MKSKELWRRAQAVIPGGVNSPVRAFHGVGGDPLFVASGKGPYLMDVDGNKYIDYVASWGPLILGHAFPSVVQAVTKAAQLGLSFGASTENEVLLAELVCRLMPAIEQLRLVSSGTEATMTALRLARAYTKREKILKFDGGYHGHHDALLVDSGSGVATLGIPGSAGIPSSVVETTITLPYNDSEKVAALFAAQGNDIAAIIVEPIAGNMNCVPGEPNFLQTLRDVTHEYGALLIFDEVISGFRVTLGGAQSLYNIQPDIITLGKIIGGGLPVGAIGGRSKLMSMLAPLGPVYQAGTLSGNPVAVAAGLATLQALEQEGVYSHLEKMTKMLLLGLTQAAEQHEIPFIARQVGSLFGLFFQGSLPNNYTEVKRSNNATFKRFFHGMLTRGVYFAPSMYEVGFVSLAHTEQEINHTITAANNVFAEIH